MSRKKKRKRDGQEERPRPKGRRFSEGLLSAVLAALVLREFVLEPFRIPSSSMEPALVGHENFGDRVFCGKRLYRLFFGEPKRWQVLVFVKDWKAPPRLFLLTCIAMGAVMAGWGYARSRGTFNLGLCVILAAGWFAFRARFPEQNYIKRAVGLPEETLQIRTGDIFINGSIARKPPHVQRECWHEFHRSRMRAPKLDWAAEGKELSFAHDPESGKAHLYSPGRALLRYAGRPTNLYLKERRRWERCRFCGVEWKTVRSTSRLRARCPNCSMEFDLRVGPGERYPEDASQEVPLADLRLRARVEVVSGAIVAVLGRGKDEFLLTLSRKGEATLSGPHGVKAKANVGGFDGPHEISFWHADMAVGLEVDGVEVFSSPYKAPQPRKPPEGSAGIGCEGGEIVLEALALDRDVYYLEAGVPPERRDGWPTIVLGREEYFFLGDNSARSNDSRLWGKDLAGPGGTTWKCKKRGDIVGKAMFIFWPPSRARLLW